MTAMPNVTPDGTPGGTPANGARHASRTRCDRVSHDNGIEELILHEVSTAAVDEWFAHLTAINEQAPPDTKVTRLLIDTTVGMQPLAYASRRGRLWLDEMAATGTMSPDTVSRVVFLYERNMLVSLVSNLIKLLVRNNAAGMNLEFFPAARRDEAIAWLLRSPDRRK